MKPAAGGNHVTSWLPLNHLWLLRLYRTVEDGPCRVLLFLTWERTALKSQLHGTDKSLFFQKNSSVPSFSGKWLRESI